MSYAPGAPPQVWAMPIDPGSKWTLALCWSKADHEVQRAPRPNTIWFAARDYPDGHAKAGQRMPAALARDTTMSERTGASIDAIRKHWTKLRRLGLARVDGRCVDLGTPSQFFDHSPTAKDPGPRTTFPEPRNVVAQPATSVLEPTTTVPSNYIPPIPANPLTPGEGDAPAPATHESDPHVHTRDHAANPHGPELEAKADAPGLPGLRGPRGQPTTVRSDDGRRVGEEGILPGVTPEQANPHLGSKLAAHRARIESHPPSGSRVELDPAVHAAVVAARMSSQLAGPRWSEWMLEALDDLGVPEREHAETVARVLGVWNDTGPSVDKPAKSQIWGWRWRTWLKAAALPPAANDAYNFTDDDILADLDAGVGS